MGRAPKTFQDAVALIRALPIRYLWIDSLCIVQDDRADWEREAQKMVDIYESAYLTIAAACATSPSSGCFLDFNQLSMHDDPTPDESSLGLRMRHTKFPRLAHPDYHPESVRVHSREDSFAFPFVQVDTFYRGSSSKIYITIEWMPSSVKNEGMAYCIPRYGRPVDPIAKSPLSTRGWVLQERLLSSRTLHFCRDQMYFDCEASGYTLGEDGSMFRDAKFSMAYLQLNENQTWPEHGATENG